jgi:hypothetical protein
MGNLNSMPDIVVAHKDTQKNSKIYIDIFTNTRIDDIIGINKRNPSIPNENEILEIGIGNSFEQRYKTKYKI